MLASKPDLKCFIQSCSFLLFFPFLKAFFTIKVYISSALPHIAKLLATSCLNVLMSRHQNQTCRTNAVIIDCLSLVRNSHLSLSCHLSADNLPNGSQKSSWSYPEHTMLYGFKHCNEDEKWRKVSSFALGHYGYHIKYLQQYYSMFN